MDTGPSSPAIVPEGTRPDALIECPNCLSKNPLKKMGVERPSDLEAELIEGLIICPDCGKETHCYWLPKELRKQQAEIFGKIKILSRQRTPMNFRLVNKLKEDYKNLFDVAQSKYRDITAVKEILEKEDGRPA